jgi:Na+-transporting NADH:ubiquinone oxidoreductase subunit C
MSDGLKTILFAAAMCVVCSALLTAAATGLQGFQQKNIQTDRQKNILKSVGLVAEDAAMSTEIIEQLYQENIRRYWVDATGELKKKKDATATDIPLYVYVINEQIESYIVPINSRGLWGKIHGYLAIGNDGETIMGFTVYKHQETPGLGGEIEKTWFQKNFVDKKIIGQDGAFVSIAIAKGSVENRVPEARQANYVDGISGATLTGKYLSEGLKEILTEYEPVSIRFRSNRMPPLKVEE